MKKVILSFVLLGLISACGGSGGVGSGVSTSQSDANLTAISGVYKTSRSGDESYLYISSQGKVTAYDCQNEASGTGDNCYSVVTRATQINYVLNSGNVTYSAANGEYRLTRGNNVLTFRYDPTKGMNDFSFNSQHRSPSGLNFNSANLNLKVGGDGRLQSTVMISDIKAALCN